jgi:hypothetical protein
VLFRSCMSDADIKVVQAIRPGDAILKATVTEA